MSRLPALMSLHAADPDDVDLLYMIGSEHLSEGRPEEAVTWLGKYVEKGRDVGAGYGLLADCFERLGRGDDARVALQSGIDAALRAGHPTMAGELRERLEETP